jgi:NADH:ubiquinone oxidoreductase subunit 4 (subunit M)
MIAILLWLGLFPQPVLNTFAPAMEKLQRTAAHQYQALYRGQQ